MMNEACEMKLLKEVMEILFNEITHLKELWGKSKYNQEEILEDLANNKNRWLLGIYQLLERQFNFDKL
jgi:hypothetical protein